MRKWSLEIKNKAKEIRLEGGSYGEITKKLGIPKSTLSVWFCDLPGSKKMFYSDRIEWLKKVRPLAVEANKKKRKKIRMAMINEVKKDMENWDNIADISTQKIILATLYWAEGNKGNGIVQFSNTDPSMMLLFITLLRNSFEIDESKFRVLLHLHYDHDEKKLNDFWSDLLKIPKTQFTKTSHKKRSKKRIFRRNIGGICVIKYNSVYLQRRIMQYAYRVAEKLVGKIEVPVV